MKSKQPRIQIFDSRHWAELPEADFHAMQLLPATGTVHEILVYLDAIPVKCMVGSVPSSLKRAVDALSELDLQQHLRTPSNMTGTMERALGALRSLCDALTQEGEDMGFEPSAATSYLSDPPSLQRNLHDAVEKFLFSQLSAGYARVATFSLILFCEDTHEGALVQSFQRERDEWRRALRPPRRGYNDFHLAIIPPPSAADGIRYLAADLGCEDKLPCVVFLGHRPDFSHLTCNRLVRWGARTLSHGPSSYPDQLREVYSTVYASGALEPGSLLSAVADRALTTLRGSLDPRSALRLLAGALGGPKFVAAAEVLFHK